MKWNLYNQGSHTLFIDGIPITGFADGDWISFEPMGGEASRMEGGDGPAMSLAVPQGGTISIKLKPTSPALGVLYEMRNNQHKDPHLFPIVFTLGTNELVSASGCAFAKLPRRDSGGPKATGVSVDFEALSMKFDTSAVESVAGGLVGAVI